eukprot:3919117-Amphidinium_carterae.1
MFIRARWLKGNGDYRVLTKQAMLIAAARMELNDITMPSEGGVSQQYIMEDLRARKVTAQSKLDELYQGKKPIPMKALKGERGLHSTIEKVKRSTLQKRSRGVLGGGLSTRYFTLDGGVLKSYKSMAEKAKATKIYQLKLAKASVENSSERRGNFQEGFMNGYSHRVVLQTKERDGELYLYAKNEMQAQAWHRAIKMAHWQPSDREAIESCVRRVTSTILVRGWDAMLRHALEILSIQANLRRFAMRLTHLELSKGWNKARLVYRKKKLEEERR